MVIIKHNFNAIVAHVVPCLQANNQAYNANLIKNVHIF